MDTDLTYLALVLTAGWIVHRQSTGRFVTSGDRRRYRSSSSRGCGAGRDLRRPVEHARLLVVAGDLLLTTGLGAVRGAAIRLSLRHGYLYRSGAR